MKCHYNAFISYRHHPDDSRVAAEIHRGLEHFKIPKEIKKTSKGITRIFRDKEELPITHNLPDEITVALENSDYLIVVCSDHTKESVWVQREIAVFLQTHTQDKVLTVLAAGKPNEVIPEILLRKNILDPETGMITQGKMEPLSCDWRTGGIGVRREELTRLVAAILSCNYDDLRQRQRQYRIKRLIAVFSIALSLSTALAAYFLYTSIKIQEANTKIKANLDQALRNQSLHLSTAAQERLDAGDRLTAIALAVEALPKQDGDRPYVPEAEQVLTQALGIYEKDSGIVAQGIINPGSFISRFWLTPDENVIYILDQRGVISSWDALTFQRLGTIVCEDDHSDEVLTTPAGNIILAADEKLGCYKPDGTPLWEQVGITWCQLAYYNESRELCVLQSRDLDYQVAFLNPDTGIELRNPIELEIPESQGSPINFHSQSYSSGMPLTIRYSSSFDEDEFVLVYPETGEKKILFHEEGFVAYTTSTSDGNLLVMISDGGIGNGWLSSLHQTSPDSAVIRCYEPHSGTLLWDSEVVTYSYTGFKMLQELPDRRQILFAAGNTFQIISSETGKMVSRCEAESGVLTLSYEKNADCARSVLQDGSLCIYSFDGNYCTAIKPIEGRLSTAYVGEYYYCLKENSSYITAYGERSKEPIWSVNCGYPYYCQKKGDMLAILDDQMYLIDLKQMRILWTQEQNMSTDWIAFSEDSKTLWHCDADHLTGFDIHDGSRREYELPVPPVGEYAYFSGTSSTFLHDCVYYCVHSDEKTWLVCWNTETKETSTWELPAAEVQSFERSKIVEVTNQFAWVTTPSGELYEIDLGKKDLQVIQAGIQEVCYVNEDCSFAAFSCGERIILRRPGEETVAEIVLGDQRPISMRMHENIILVLYNDGNLYRYDQNGKPIGTTEIFASTEIYYWNARLGNHADFLWTFTDDGMLVLKVLDTGNLVDCSNWTVTAEIPQFITYDEKRDSLICADRNTLFAFQRYDFQQLREYAVSQLNGFQLSQEQRYHYGLES